MLDSQINKTCLKLACNLKNRENKLTENSMQFKEQRKETTNTKTIFSLLLYKSTKQFGIIIKILEHRIYSLNMFFYDV